MLMLPVVVAEPLPAPAAVEADDEAMVVSVSLQYVGDVQESFATTPSSRA